jgi:hypothetical protein
MMYAITSPNRTVTVRCLTAARLRKTPVGLRPLWCFAPPQFGQGSLLRNALLPAQTVSYSRNVMRNTAQNKLEINKKYLDLMKYCVKYNEESIL